MDLPKIVLINQSVGYLMTDIVNSFAVSKHYGQVELITGSADLKLDNSVKVRKIIRYRKDSMLTRSISWGVSFFQILFLILIKYRKFEVLYVTNPPTSYFVSLFTMNKFSIIIYDTYPEALKNIGISEKSLIFKLWAGINRKVFKKAQHIFTLSSGMAEQLSIYVQRKKINVIANWSSFTQEVPIVKKDNRFIREQNVEDKFIIMYSGNIGYTHSVEVIIELAERFRKDQSILFFIIGEGLKKDLIQNRVNALNLTNCRFYGWLPIDIIPYSLSAADISIVTVNETNSLLSVPSKTYNLLAVGAPLLCIAPENSELTKLVNQHNNGAAFNQDQLDEMVQYILKIKNDKFFASTLSDNSRIASKSYTAENAKLYVDYLIGI